MYTEDYAKSQVLAYVHFVHYKEVDGDDVA